MAFASLLAAAACSFPEQPLPPGTRQVVVHAVLDPAQRYQLVHLSWTDGVKADPRDLDAAAVSLIAPDGTILAAKQDSTLNYLRNSVALPDYRIDLQAAGVTLVPGATYQLRVVTRGGEVVTGETTIPTAAPMSVPLPTEFRPTRDTVRLSWARVEGARAYEVQVWSSEFYDGYGQYTFTRMRYSAFVDTSVVLAGTARTWDNDDVFPIRGTVTVYVYAVDDAYYEYYRLLGDPFTGAAPSRLQGGLGLFGSVAVVAEQPMNVKFPP